MDITWSRFVWKCCKWSTYPLTVASLSVVEDCTASFFWKSHIWDTLKCYYQESKGYRYEINHVVLQKSSDKKMYDNLSCIQLMERETRKSLTDLSVNMQPEFEGVSKN